MRGKSFNLLLIFLLIVLMTIWYLIKENQRDKTQEYGLLGLFTIEKIRYGRGIPKIYYTYTHGNEIIKDTYVCSNLENIRVGDKIFGWYSLTDSFTDCSCKAPDTLNQKDILHLKYIPKEYCLE